MHSPSLAELFSVPSFAKPRSLRQTWVKDVGFYEAPYLERMGLVELADFLEVAAPRLDFVKVVTDQIIYSPAEWMRRKIEPYLDHTFFARALTNMGS